MDKKKLRSTLDVILHAAVDTWATQPLSLMQEGAMKVHILGALLESAYVLREGSAHANHDWLLWSTNGLVNAELTARTSNGQVKPDIRIEGTDSLRFELKVFAEIGSKDTFNRSPTHHKTTKKATNLTSYLWDLRHVISGTAHAAIVVCSARHYDTARGKKWEQQGAKGVNLSKLLPNRDLLKNAATEHSGTFETTTMVVRAATGAAPLLSEFAPGNKARRAPEGRVAFAVFMP